MKGLSCPRCDSRRTAKVSDSPVKGKWEAYRCEDCFYVWRDTEDLADINKNVEYWKKTAVRFWD